MSEIESLINYFNSIGTVKVKNVKKEGKYLSTILQATYCKNGTVFLHYPKTTIPVETTPFGETYEYFISNGIVIRGGKIELIGKMDVMLVNANAVWGQSYPCKDFLKTKGFTKFVKDNDNNKCRWERVRSITPRCPEEEPEIGHDSDNEDNIDYGDLGESKTAESDALRSMSKEDMEAEEEIMWFESLQS